VQEKTEELNKLAGRLSVAFKVMNGIVSALTDFVCPVAQGACEKAFCPQIRHSVENALAGSAEIFRCDIEYCAASSDNERWRALPAHILLHLNERLADTRRPRRMSVKARCLRKARNDTKLSDQPSIGVVRLTMAHHSVEMFFNGQYHKHSRIFAVRASAQRAELRANDRPFLGGGDGQMRPLVLPQRFRNLREVLTDNLRRLVKNEIFVLTAMRASVSNLEDSHARL
jgi:hypothetical protein